MQKFARRGRFLLPYAGVLVALGLASHVSADEYAMFGRLTIISGTTTERVVTGLGNFQVTAAAPQPIAIPGDVFELSGMNFRAFPTVPQVAQFVETFTTSQPTPATFSGGNGPGSFAFCPPAGNPVNPNCLVPASGTGGRNGRVAYIAGANQFGGSLNLLRRIVGSVSQRVATAPLQFVHRPINRPTHIHIAGGPFSGTHQNVQPGGDITQSPVLGPLGSIVTAGPVVGQAPPVGTQPYTGFPFTTGMVIHSRNIPAPATFTFTGSDARTPGGFGEITLVAGGTGKSLAAGNDFPVITRLAIKVPEPTITIAAMGGAASLALFGAARRRRLTNRD